MASLASNPQPGGLGFSIYVPSDRVAQLYPHAPGSLFIISCDSKNYGGGILTLLHTGAQLGGPGPCIHVTPVTGWPSFNPRHRVPSSSSPATLRTAVEVF
jgi:hypothetical protein